MRFSMLNMAKKNALLPIYEGEDRDEQIDRGIPLQRSDLFS